MIVSLASAHRTDYLLRQTPGSRGLWNGLDFASPSADAATLVVFDDLGGDFKTRAPVSRRILAVTEPPELKPYSRRFLEQFGTVLSPYPLDAGMARVVVTQTGLPWFYGVRFEDGGVRFALNYDDLATLQPGPKTPVISVVCSTKSTLPGHRERLALVQYLKAHLKDRLIVRGRGFEPIIDKADVIAPYRYHLVLENNALGHFWTEKLADAYLGYSLPVFSGTPAASQDFPAGAMVTIDRTDLKGSLAVIERLLDEDPYDQHLAAIREARQRVLHEHNFFAVVAKAIAAMPPEATLSEAQTLHQSARGGSLKALRRALRSGLKSITGARRN